MKKFFQSGDKFEKYDAGRSGDLSLSSSDQLKRNTEESERIRKELQLLKKRLKELKSEEYILKKKEKEEHAAAAKRAKSSPSFSSEIDNLEKRRWALIRLMIELRDNPQQGSLPPASLLVSGKKKRVKKGKRERDGGEEGGRKEKKRGSLIRKKSEKKKTRKTSGREKEKKGNQEKTEEEDSKDFEEEKKEKKLIDDTNGDFEEGENTETTTETMTETMTETITETVTEEQEQSEEDEENEEDENYDKEFEEKEEKERDSIEEMIFFGGSNYQKKKNQRDLEQEDEEEEEQIEKDYSGDVPIPEDVDVEIVSKQAYGCYVGVADEQEDEITETMTDKTEIDDLNETEFELLSVEEDKGGSQEKKKKEKKKVKKKEREKLETTTLWGMDGYLLQENVRVVYGDSSEDELVQETLLEIEHEEELRTRAREERGKEEKGEKSGEEKMEQEEFEVDSEDVWESSAPPRRRVTFTESRSPFVNQTPPPPENLSLSIGAVPPSSPFRSGLEVPQSSLETGARSPRIGSRGVENLEWVGNDGTTSETAETGNANFMSDMKSNTSNVGRGNGGNNSGLGVGHPEPTSSIAPPEDPSSKPASVDLSYSTPVSSNASHTVIALPPSTDSLASSSADSTTSYTTPLITPNQESDSLFSYTTSTGKDDFFDGPTAPPQAVPQISQSLQISYTDATIGGVDSSDTSTNRLAYSDSNTDSSNAGDFLYLTPPSVMTPSSSSSTISTTQEKKQSDKKDEKKKSSFNRADSKKDRRGTFAFQHLYGQNGSETRRLMSSLPPSTSFSFSSSIEESKQLDAWNLRFQNCLKSYGEAKTSGDLMLANMELMHLSEDFIHASRTVGKIIISEVYVPIDKKTIKPRTLGGRAGGEKYMVHNILFKFAVDSSNLFEGSNWAAAKIANHELKGLMSYFNLGLKEVFMPLMALVDYRGFRLVAMSVLPVNATTLIYGTHDAGLSIVKCNKKFNAIMRRTMKRLNLKPHVCGAIKFRTRMLCSAADIEGHFGTDGKFYLLDFSRTMPPVRPDRRFHNGHLYQLMRQELVAKFPLPLCSDGYSGFIIHDKNMRTHNREIDEATDNLLEITIPEFALRLCEVVESGDVGSVDVSVLMHRAGINLRFIGLLIGSLQSYWDLEKPDSKKRQQIRDASALLLLEATARVIKNELNKMLRRQMKQLKLPLEVPYRKIVIEFLNVVFGSDQESHRWWRAKLPSLLRTFFSIQWYPFQTEARDWRHEAYSGSGRELLFQRIVKLTGLEFSKYARNKFNGIQKWNYREPLDLLDLTEMGDRVKYMDIVSSSQGNFFFYKALQETDKSIVKQLLEQAIEKYEQALNAMPSNQETMSKCSTSRYRLLLIHAEENKWIDEFGIFFDGKDPYVQKMQEMFRVSIEANPNDTLLLCLYAQFAEKKREYQRAEEYFLDALRIDPTFTYGAIMYGNLLTQRGHDDEITEVFFTPLSDAKAIDPLTGQELGGLIKVYHTDGAYKTIPATSSMSAADICLIMCKNLNISEGQENWGIFKIEARSGLSTIEETILASLSKKDFQKNQMGPREKPWVLVQRPKNKTILYFAKKEEKSSGGKKKKDSSRASQKTVSVSRLARKRGNVSVIAQLLSTKSEYLELLAHTEDQLTLSVLLVNWPLFTTVQTLLCYLSYNFFTNLSAICFWVSAFPDDLSEETLTKFVTGFGSGSSEAETALIQSLLKSQQMAIESQSNLCGQLLPIQEKVEKKEGIEDLSVIIDLDEDATDDHIRNIAFQLRIWALMIHCLIDYRDLMKLNQNIETLEMYNVELAQFVRRHICQDPPLPPTTSLHIFHFFSRLAVQSFILSDFSTSHAIIQGLDSPEVRDLLSNPGSSWLACSDFAEIRHFYKESESYFIFSSQSYEQSLTRLPNSSFDSVGAVGLAETGRSRYSRIIKNFVSKKIPFLPVTDWTIQEIQGPSIQIERKMGRPVLNLQKARSVIEVMQRHLSGINSPTIGGFLTPLDLPLLVSLFCGMFKSVANLPSIIWTAKNKRKKKDITILESLIGHDPAKTTPVSKFQEKRLSVNPTVTFNKKSALSGSSSIGGSESSESESDFGIPLGLLPRTELTPPFNQQTLPSTPPLNQQTLTSTPPLNQQTIPPGLSSSSSPSTSPREVKLQARSPKPRSPRNSMIIFRSSGFDREQEKRSFASNSSMIDRSSSQDDTELAGRRREQIRSVIRTVSSDRDSSSLQPQNSQDDVRKVSLDFPAQQTEPFLRQQGARARGGLRIVKKN